MNNDVRRRLGRLEKSTLVQAESKKTVLNWFVISSVMRKARAQFMRDVGLTYQERVAWLCFWESAAQLVRDEEWEAERRLYCQVDLTDEEYVALCDALDADLMNESVPAEIQEMADQAQVKWEQAWAGLDDETHALVEAKRIKEQEFIEEIGRWTDSIDESEGPKAFHSAQRKVAEVLGKLDAGEMALLALRDPMDWLALGRA